MNYSHVGDKTFPRWEYIMACDLLSFPVSLDNFHQVKLNYLSTSFKSY